METLFVIKRGRELGLSDTMSLQQLWITQGGKLGMEAAAAKALLDSKGFGHAAFITTEEDAAVIVARPGIDIDPIINKYLKDGELKNVGGKGWFISYWDLERVRKIKTWEHKQQISLDQKGTWQSHPGPLYRHRGLMDAGREAASDLLGGIYSMEEIAEIELNEQHRLPAPVTAEALEVAAGTGANGAEQIDQDIIRPEDETRLRRYFTQGGCTGADITAVLIEIQQTAKTADEAAAQIDIEIAKLKAIVEMPAHEPQRRRKGKPTPMEKAKQPPTDGAEGSEFLQAEDAEYIPAEPEDKPVTPAAAEDAGPIDASGGGPAQEEGGQQGEVTEGSFAF